MIGKSVRYLFIYLFIYAMLSKSWSNLFAPFLVKYFQNIYVIVILYYSPPPQLYF